MTTYLDRLKVDEVSGVGDPANEAPGWLVMKSRQRFAVRMEAIRKAEDDGLTHLVRRMTSILSGQGDPGPLPQAKPVRRAMPATGKGLSEARVVEFAKMVDGLAIQEGISDEFREGLARFIALAAANINQAAIAT
jgi:hypothetical protein